MFNLRNCFNSNEKIDYELYDKMIEFGNGLDKKGVHLFIKSILMQIQSEDIINSTQYEIHKNGLQESSLYSKDYLFLMPCQYQKFNNPDIQCNQKKYEFKKLENNSENTFHFLSRPWNRDRLAHVLNGTGDARRGDKIAREYWIKEDKELHIHHHTTLFLPWNIIVLPTGRHTGIIPILAPENIQWPLEIDTEYNFSRFLSKYKIKKGQLLDKNSGEYVEDVNISPLMQVIYELGRKL